MWDILAWGAVLFANINNVWPDLRCIISSCDITHRSYDTCYSILSDSSLAPIITVHKVHDCDYLALFHVQNFGHSHDNKNNL